MVIYLKHPQHGAKVACSEFEAEEDKKNGWTVFDPEAPVQSEPASPEQTTELPSFLAPAPKSKGGRPKVK